MAKPKATGKTSKEKPKTGTPKPKRPAAITVSLKKASKVAGPRLQVEYKEKIRPKLMKEFNFKSPMQIPRLKKVVLNVGMGEAIQNAKLLDSAVEEMTLITGQKPVVTRAKKSIAGFKLRAVMAIGCKVTLRGVRMYEFLDRLISVALPGIRDFRGVSPSSFDGNGNYSMGLKEQLIFPEIRYDDVVKTHGMDITFNTSAKSNEEGHALLKQLGMPFRK